MNDISMDFVSNPELSFSESNLDLTYEVATDLFKPYNDTVTNVKVTLLNPYSMYEFYYKY